MAITSITGVQTAPVYNRMVTIFGNQADGGIYRANSPTTGYGGSAFTIPPPQGETKSYLGSVKLNTYYSNPFRFGSVLVFDLIYGLTVTNSTSLQTLTSPAIGNRDINGTQLGDGVYLIVWTGGNLGGATTTLSVNYTNSAGVPGRTGVSTAFNSPGGGRFFFIGLQNGDTGVRSVQSAQFSALPGGGMNLYAVRPISLITSPTVVSTDAQVDALHLGLPEVYNASTIFIAYGTTGQVYGEMKFLYG